MCTFLSFSPLVQKVSPLVFPPALLSDVSALHMSYWQTTSRIARADSFPISYYLLRVWIVPVWHFPRTQYLELCTFVEVSGAYNPFSISAQ